MISMYETLGFLGDYFRISKIKNNCAKNIVQALGGLLKKFDITTEHVDVNSHG